MDALRLLTGPDAAGPLAAAVAEGGGRLVSWRAVQVDHRPGRGTTVAYRVRVARGDREGEEVLGAATGYPGDREAPGVLVVPVVSLHGSPDVAVWPRAADPGLPALATACDPAAVRRLLAPLGPAGASPHAVTLRYRSYRPRRRAVVEARTPAGRVFLKVVPPGRVADLDLRHRLLADAGVPVARPAAVTADGLLVLPELPGRPLRDVLRRDGAAALAAAEPRRLLDRLPAALLDLPRRRSWADAADHYAEVVAAALPAQSARVRNLAGAVRAGLDATGEPVTPVHGDLHEGQLLVRSGRVTGVLDVDAAGPGHRGDDLACLLAHVDVLARVHGADAARLRSAGQAWLAAMDADPLTDPGSLRLRTAGVLLSLATGPHRVQQDRWQEATAARLDLVARWLAMPLRRA